MKQIKLFPFVNNVQCGSLYKTKERKKKMMSKKEADKMRGRVRC